MLRAGPNRGRRGRGPRAGRGAYATSARRGRATRAAPALPALARRTFHLAARPPLSIGEGAAPCPAALPMRRLWPRCRNRRPRLHPVRSHPATGVGHATRVRLVRPARLARRSAARGRHAPRWSVAGSRRRRTSCPRVDLDAATSLRGLVLVRARSRDGARGRSLGRGVSRVSRDPPRRPRRCHPS